MVAGDVFVVLSRETREEKGHCSSVSFGWPCYTVDGAPRECVVRVRRPPSSPCPGVSISEDGGFDYTPLKLGTAVSVVAAAAAVVVVVVVKRFGVVVVAW